MDDIEFHNKEFPKTFKDFVYLARNFSEKEIELCDKEGLIKLCVALKEKELEYYIKYHELLNSLE